MNKGSKAESKPSSAVQHHLYFPFNTMFVYQKLWYGMCWTGNINGRENVANITSTATQMKCFLHEINCFQNPHGRAGCDDGDGRWGELVTARGKPHKANTQSLPLTYKHTAKTCSDTCVWNSCSLRNTRTEFQNWIFKRKKSTLS